MKKETVRLFCMILAGFLAIVLVLGLVLPVLG